jgi:mediator of replication checkpoint protein 1
VVEKIVNDAVQGRMRMKKRDRGLGFEDDESESDDDNSHVRRPKLPKKRRILGDTLDAYRQYLYSLISITVLC